MIIEAFRRVTDLVRITGYYKREIRTKAYSWYGDIKDAESERYSSLIQTYKLRAAMFTRSDEASVMMDRICHSDWYLSPQSQEDKFCSNYVDFLRNLSDMEQRQIILDKMKTISVSPFVRRVLNPPES